MALSDDSFAWSDASKDSETISINMKEEKDEDSDTNTKNHLQETLHKDGSQKSKKKGKKRKHESSAEVNGIADDKLQHIKSEPESDADAAKKRKRQKSNEHKNSEEAQESTDYDDSYLNYRVKQEQITFVEPAQVKSEKKKKKRKSENALEEIRNLNHEKVTAKNTQNQEENSNVKEEEKKKKKKKKNKNETNMSIDGFESSDDNFRAKKKLKSKKQDRKNNYSLDINESSQLEEISRIDSSATNNNFLDDDHINENCNGDINNESIKMEISANHITPKSKSLKEKSKISDRLKFENEDSVDFMSQEHEDTQTSKPLKQFIDSNNDLSLIKSNSKTKSIFTEDDEIWIVKAPHELNIKDFEGINLKLDNKSKLKINDKTYDSVMDNTIDKVPILSFTKTKSHIQHMPINGLINLRKRIPKARILEENVINDEATFIPLPETKCRHPLFGANYKKATKIPASVAERLNDTAMSSEVNDERKERKKHKKRKRKVEYESEAEAKAIELVVDDVATSKKKRKRKSSVKEAPAAKKAKYNKNESESADVWESEQAIEKNLFDF